MKPLRLYAETGVTHACPPGTHPFHPQAERGVPVAVSPQRHPPMDTAKKRENAVAFRYSLLIWPSISRAASSRVPRIRAPSSDFVTAS